MPVQIFDENTAVKYPLSDMHESPVPNDILVDLSVSGPGRLLLGLESAPSAGTAPSWISSYPPVTPVELTADFPGETSRVFMTNLVKRSGVLFVSFEAYPGDALCHLSIVSPEAFKIYRMEAAENVTAWVVFGPGISRDFEYRDLAVPVDARCLLTAGEPSRMLSVNGEYYPAPRALTIAFNDAFKTDGSGGVSRNDDFFQDIQYDLREDIPSRRDRLYDIGGALPDENGNINLVEFHRILHVSSSSSSVETYAIPIGDQELLDGASGAVLGAVINNVVWQGCEDWYATFRQKFDLGVGGEDGKSPTGGIELPMDYIFTGCLSSSSSSVSSSSVSSSSSSSSSAPVGVACATGCVYKHQHWSYGDCAECAEELAALIDPGDYCFSIHAGQCGYDPAFGCEDGPPGYKTVCGVCCTESCYDICAADPDPLKNRPAWPGGTGLIYAETEAGALAYAMDHCRAMSEGCLYGAADCSTHSDHGCIAYPSVYDSGTAMWRSEWKLCCFSEELPS